MASYFTSFLGLAFAGLSFIRVVPVMASSG
jgi:hypothetical protein